MLRPANLYNSKSSVRRDSDGQQENGTKERNEKSGKLRPRIPVDNPKVGPVGDDQNMGFLGT
eukprot:1560200-Pleurochrysis_carterae.AAC.3